MSLGITDHQMLSHASRLSAGIRSMSTNICWGGGSVGREERGLAYFGPFLLSAIYCLLLSETDREQERMKKEGRKDSYPPSIPLLSFVCLAQVTCGCHYQEPWPTHTHTARVNRTPPSQPYASSLPLAIRQAIYKQGLTHQTNGSQSHTSQLYNQHSAHTASVLIRVSRPTMFYTPDDLTACFQPNK